MVIEVVGYCKLCCVPAGTLLAWVILGEVITD